MTAPTLALADLTLAFRSHAGLSEVLHGISLSSAPGETVALVGASGSGKTSVVQLMARFFAPTQGRILLDGQDIAQMDLVALRSQLGWVGQHVVLFDDTVAANIAYGRPEATQAQIEQAAAAANALEFIQALPHGWQSRVGVNGGQLSGGQRQRIAIARAFMKDAPVLLLDEATSALDNASERAVKDAVALLRQQRSVLVVAHRLSTVRDADRIIVMEHGRAVESGSHESLAAANGAYARLLASGSDALTV